MTDMQNERPGEPGTPEGETGARESDPLAPSVEGRDLEETSDDQSSGVARVRPRLDGDDGRLPRRAGRERSFPGDRLSAGDRG